MTESKTITYLSDLEQLGFDFSNHHFFFSCEFDENIITFDLFSSSFKLGPIHVKY